MSDATTMPVRFVASAATGPRRALPDEFADLAPWVHDWALSNERSRMEKLLASNVDELRPFYDALLARLPAIKQWLDRFPLDAMPPEAQTLFDMALTFVETAHVIDLGWKVTDIEDKFPHDRFRVKSPH